MALDREVSGKREESLRIVLGILPNVQSALALTEALISCGCAAHSIFLLMPRESSDDPLLQRNALLVPIAEDFDTSVYCVGNPESYNDLVFDRAVQRQRCLQLIDRFSRPYPHHWQFHQSLVRQGSPVSVVHLESYRHDEPLIARTVLSYSVRRLQISDLPSSDCAV